MKEKLMVSAELCTGCRTCEVTCSFAKERAFWPEAARIAVIKQEAEGWDRPLVCRQCQKPACALACPVGALSRPAALGWMQLDEEKCLGCGTCVEACPFGAMRLHPASGQALFCDTCGGDPACAKRCTTQAIAWCTPADYARKVGQRRQLQDQVWAARGGEEA